MSIGVIDASEVINIHHEHGHLLTRCLDISQPLAYSLLHLTAILEVCKPVCPGHSFQPHISSLHLIRHGIDEVHQMAHDAGLTGELTVLCLILSFRHRHSLALTHADSHHVHIGKSDLLFIAQEFPKSIVAIRCPCPPAGLQFEGYIMLQQEPAGHTGNDEDVLRGKIMNALLQHLGMLDNALRVAIGQPHMLTGTKVCPKDQRPITSHFSGMTRHILPISLGADREGKSLPEKAFSPMNVQILLIDFQGRTTVNLLDNIGRFHLGDGHDPPQGTPAKAGENLHLQFFPGVNHQGQPGGHLPVRQKNPAFGSQPALIGNAAEKLDVRVTLAGLSQKISKVKAHIRKEDAHSLDMLRFPQPLQQLLPHLLRAHILRRKGQDLRMTPLIGGEADQDAITGHRPLHYCLSRHAAQNLRLGKIPVQPPHNGLGTLLVPLRTEHGNQELAYLQLPQSYPDLPLHSQVVRFLMYQIWHLLHIHPTPTNAIDEKCRFLCLFYHIFPYRKRCCPRIHIQTRINGVK